MTYFGTEEPAQPNDVPRGGMDARYGSEMEHNSLEFEADAARDQWRDMHQVFLHLLITVL